MRPTLLAMGALLLGLSATPSAAAPAAGLPDLVPDSGLELVAGGCGPGFHRAYNGRCYPNGYAPRRYYRPPVYGARCVSRRTPYGWKKVCRY